MKTKTKTDETNVNPTTRTVLVATFRPENAEWIRDRKFYNLPLPKCGRVAFHDRISRVVLIAEGHPTVAYAAKLKDVVDRDWLKSEGYKVAPKNAAHGEKYALYELNEKLSAANVLSDASADVFVSSSRCPNVRIDAAFYAKPYPKTGGKSMPYIFDELKPYFKKWRLAMTFSPVQEDFLYVFDKQAGVLQNGDPMKNIVSLFSGAGGLDLGFEKAGFPIIWANEFDKDIWATYRANHKKTYLCTKSICDVAVGEVPDCVGIIGGPPCQSWSEGGAKRGIKDKRGQLFFDYIRILKAKRPLFFLAENVSGMLLERHREALAEIKRQFKDAGYNLSFTPVNAWDYGVPQDRERVLFVGYRRDIGKTFKMPNPIPLAKRKTIRDAIGDLEDVKPGRRKNGLVRQVQKLEIPNHEFMTGGFSSIFMSRNRVRDWDEPAFTVQAGGRQSQLHPSAPKMVKVDGDRFVFKRGSEKKYRRISVREAARIQTFPDSFIFLYDNIAHGYKMIGNAVPVLLAKIVAKQIKKDLADYLEVEKK